MTKDNENDNDKSANGHEEQQQQQQSTTTAAASASLQSQDAVVKLAPFNPTCQQAQQTAIGLFQLDSNDSLFDLGCGDGRFLIEAASRVQGLTCVGVEMDPVFCRRAQERLGAIEANDDDSAAVSLSLADRVNIVEGDALDEELLFRHGFNEATAIFVYLLPKGLRLVRPLIERISGRSGKGNDANDTRSHRKVRVVSYMFSIKGWEPVCIDRTTRGECALYLYESGKSW